MYQARNAYARGELDNAEQIIRRLLHQDANFVHYRPQFLGQITMVLLGKISFQRADMEEALAQFAAIIPSESLNMFEIHVATLVDPAICESALGNPSRAIEMLRSARHIAAEENLPHLAIVAAATQIEFEIRFGDPEIARQIAAETNLDELWLSACAPSTLPWIEVEAIARARFFLQLQDDDLVAAQGTADTFLKNSTTAGYHLSEITALVMRSHALRLLGIEQDSRRDLQRALAFAQKCGVVQIFLGFGGEVMVQVRTVSEQQAGPACAWADHVVATWESTFRLRSSATSAFTPRELDVLCELAKDQSTKMIAKTLLLSPETVKKHLKAIFLKLEVGKREDAVTQARRRALMP
jgi:ATP/maltotriose-dependent transcriptional regulator MalT